MKIKNTPFWIVFSLFLLMFSCKSKMPVKIAQTQIETSSKVLEIGANRTSAYIPLLRQKKVAVVGNQTSVIFKNQHSFIHLVDSLLSLNIDVKKVFAPEHGFRGDADAGELVKDGVDKKQEFRLFRFTETLKNQRPNN